MRFELDLTFNKRRHETVATAVDRGHMRRAEMRRQQQGAFLGAISEHASARRARLLGHLAKSGIQVWCVDLQRMVQRVTAKQSSVAAIGKFKDDMPDGVARSRLDQEAVINRVHAVNQMGLAVLDHW